MCWSLGNVFAQEPLLVMLKGVRLVTLYWWWTVQVNVQMQCQMAEVE